MIEGEHLRSERLLPQELSSQAIGGKCPAGLAARSHLRDDVPAIVLEWVAAQVVAIWPFDPQRISQSTVKAETVSNARMC